ncbi:isoaspartyl peptidase/L-asparaginase [Phenylobacterium sp.]|uniref:isoaspartyl peptidase/L-asparaginase family protein n=1 Tax=Phenylobacterium sp. TaxID=1871053 RepID=UPI002ED810D8
MTVGWSLAVHGGAGAIPRGRLSPAQVCAYETALQAALAEGEAVLRSGGPALDAVQAAVCELEDSPLFNAGRGAAFTSAGDNELDASIMGGPGRAAGAVAGVSRARNPVSLARAVMERSPHVLLMGEGADAFAEDCGAILAEPGHFFTTKRWASLEEWLAANGRPSAAARPRTGAAHPLEFLVHDEGKRGTVGAVARDVAGRLAAAGSTGGLTGKLWGRVGDTALIGAGVYADPAGCAVACTGTGEHFIRVGAAKRISDLVELGGLAVAEACARVISNEIASIGGEGGVIAVGPRGDAVWRFNTSGMFRARVSERRPREVRLFGDEETPAPSGG